MEFVLQRRSPARNVAGIAAVVVFHVLTLMALMHGLARSPVAFTPASPIEWVSIIEPAPPPPKVSLLKPVSRAAVTNQIPQPVVPEVVPVSSDAISTETVPATATPADGAFTVADSGQGTSSAGLIAACPNAQDVRSTIRYPAQARRDGLQGEVMAQFLVTANGDIRNVSILSSSNRAFNNAVMSAVRQFSCIGQGRDVTVEVPFSFKLD